MIKVYIRCLNEKAKPVGGLRTEEMRALLRKRRMKTILRSFAMNVEDQAT